MSIIAAIQKSCHNDLSATHHFRPYRQNAASKSTHSFYMKTRTFTFSTAKADSSAATHCTPRCRPGSVNDSHIAATSFGVQ